MLPGQAWGIAAGTGIPDHASGLAGMAVNPLDWHPCSWHANLLYQS